MSLKRTEKNANENTAGIADPTNDPPRFRENPDINAKIDAYIKANPKRCTERMRAGVLRKLEQNPELKQAYQTLVKNLPEEQQEKMMANLALRTQRKVTRRQAEAPPRVAQGL